MTFSPLPETLQAALSEIKADREEIRRLRDDLTNAKSMIAHFVAETDPEELDRLRADLKAVEAWQEEGARLFASNDVGVLFRLGRWWERCPLRPKA